MNIAAATIISWHLFVQTYSDYNPLTYGIMSISGIRDHDVCMELGLEWQKNWTNDEMTATFECKPEYRDAKES